MIIIAYLLIVVFFVMEGRLRQGKEARSLEAGQYDRASTRTVGFAFTLSTTLLLAAPLLNYFRIAVIDGLVVGGIGLVVMLTGLGLRYWAHKTLGAFYTRTLLVKTDQHLVDSGPYKMVRNPGYLGTLLLFIGAGLVASNWLVLLSITVITSIAYFYRIRVEEAMLKSTFGEEYTSYAARTWKLIPLIY